AQIGSRLVEGTARKLADDFFGRFAQAVAAVAPPTGVEAEVAAPPATLVAAPLARGLAPRGLAPWLWVAGVVVLVAVLLLILARF
ncbi:MAG: carbon monoxide dehydrogenase, partial [Alphaproteobacteria bacterium]